jgi:hypothetical protein
LLSTLGSTGEEKAAAFTREFEALRDGREAALLLCRRTLDDPGASLEELGAAYGLALKWEEEVSE